MQCGDHPLHGVIEQDRRDAGIGHLRFRFVQVRAAEERLVLFDRLAFVVVDGPAAADPARVRGARHGHAVVERQCAGADIAARQQYVRRTDRCVTRLGLNLRLQVPPKAIGIREADLNLQALRRQRIADMGFAYQRGGKGRFAAAAEAIEVVDKAAGGALEQRCLEVSGTRDKRL